METYQKLSEIDVSKHIEKKGSFSYLSWPFAVHQLRLASPSATWEVKRFNGVPYLHTELGYFVEVSVTVDGIELSQIHPVINSRNQPILAPTPFDINTSIQRCLVKAIALHGLGLSIYAGEDLISTPSEKRATGPENALPVPELSSEEELIDNIPDDIKKKAAERFQSIMAAAKGQAWIMASNLFYSMDNDSKLLIWEMLKPYPAIRKQIKQQQDSAPIAPAYEPGAE
jgi:hypothetical protein